MKAKLVFTDWRDRHGDSVYGSAVGVSLSLGDFHSGTTLTAIVELDGPDAEELRTAKRKGYRAIFELIPEGV
jgi:hypothetical protein